MAIELTKPSPEPVVAAPWHHMPSSGGAACGAVGRLPLTDSTDCVTCPACQGILANEQWARDQKTIVALQDQVAHIQELYDAAIAGRHAAMPSLQDAEDDCRPDVEIGGEA